MSSHHSTAALAQGTAVLRGRSKWLQGDIKKEIDEILSSSEFRGLTFEIDQMRYLFERGPQFSYRLLARIFEKSKSHIHTLLTAKEPVEEINIGEKKMLVERNRGPSLLTKHDEEELIAWIGKQQMKGNCPTPGEVRYQGSIILEKRTGIFHDRQVLVEKV